MDLYSQVLYCTDLVILAQSICFSSFQAPLEKVNMSTMENILKETDLYGIVTSDLQYLHVSQLC